MPFLEKLFPGADFKIIHLTRNPAASINGLYDGWLHRGFFSHNLSAILKARNTTLNIAGYSECHEWGKWWWKYDLPPGWEGYTKKRLEEVCAFQWYSANKTLIDYFSKNRKKYCRIKYENIIGSPDSRKKEMETVVKFMGLNLGVIGGLDFGNLPVVQATEAPEPYRWKKRQDSILPLLDDQGISDIAEELNYSKDNIGEWF
jgi:hypothetical protein